MGHTLLICRQRQLKLLHRATKQAEIRSTKGELSYVAVAVAVIGNIASLCSLGFASPLFSLPAAVVSGTYLISVGENILEARFDAEHAKLRESIALAFVARFGIAGAMGLYAAFDGADEAGMVVRLGWFDMHKVKLMQQELIAVYRPLTGGEGWLELQTSFQTTLPKLVLGRTNFGFLGLRVAASISAHYGGGRLSNSDGLTGEKAIFGRQAQWVDYSGPITDKAWEGVTWFENLGSRPATVEV